MADACRHLRVAWQPIKDAWVCVDCLKVCLESVDLANEANWTVPYPPSHLPAMQAWQTKVRAAAEDDRG